MTTVNEHLSALLTPLGTAAVDTERHVGLSGWDQAPRLFALVRTGALLEREPSLAEQLQGHDPESYTAVEQEGLPLQGGLEQMLASIAWPEDVDGAALAVERIVVPPEAERDLPADPEEASQVLADHPDRRDVRLFVAVARDGDEVTLLRQRMHDSDDKVATGTEIAPGLVTALRATLEV